MKTGLVSVTFRSLSPEEIINLVKHEHLDGIEWGSDIHMPPDDLENAKNISKKMQNLEVLSYGTYYRLAENNSFHKYLETALAINAKNIRVWAGTKNFEDADHDYFLKAVEDAKKIASAAAQYGIDISFEYHEGTLTNTQKSTIRLLNAIDMPNVYSYWQPLKGRSIDENIQDIKELSDMKKLKSIHVFQWKNDDVFKLEDGIEEWKKYLSAANAEACLLEFVKDEQIENFHDDAKTLLKIKAEIGK